MLKTTFFTTKNIIAKLQDNKMNEIMGGGTYTRDNTCGDRSEYPACAISGCWGAQSCFPDTGETFLSTIIFKQFKPA